MSYKKKVTILSALVAVLALIYFLILFFDSDRRRDPAFAWLDSSLFNMADRIELFGSNGLTVLNQVNGVWHLLDDGVNYPIKQGRVEDLMSALSRRDTYPVRALSAEARERLGFGESSSSRIRVTGGAGPPLLDLLVGSGATLGREVYLKFADRTEIHSGEDRFTLFTEARGNFWLDMRLFSPAAIADIQQAEVNLTDGETYALRRHGGGWVILGSESEVLDVPRVDAWLRGVLEAEAENFATEDPQTIDAFITLRFGDGQTKSLFAGPLDENNNRQVLVSDSSFIYLLSEWTGNRIFRESSFFLR